MDTTTKLKVGFAALMILSGIGVASYPVISNAVAQRHASEAIQNYDDTVKSMDTEKLDAAKEAARRYNQQLDSAVERDAAGEAEDTGTSYVDLVDVGESLGYITIPKIDVNLPIYEGTSDDVLQRGVGHLEGSSYPLGGESTHSVLTGHRGLPIETPAVTVNVVCGSGLNCVNMAAQMIEAGDADIVVAGGMENMDMAPFALQKARYGYRMGAPMGKSEIVDTMVNDALWDATGFNKHMGMTAENVCTNETYQKKYGYSPITREMLDEFSYNSQLKADKAIKDGAFKDEIVPVVIKGKKGDTVFDTDEGPRLSAPEVLAKLKPAFTKDGIVTAGNSSAINDGAAALVVMSEEKAKELGVKPLATWVAGALAGVEPEVMGLGPIAATKKVMAKTGMTVADMDLVEANEAFAAQSIAVGEALGFDKDKLNVNGGAIALGHPVGASGARILVTLLYAMKHRGAHKGLATLCIGGGMGCATIVEMD